MARKKSAEPRKPMAIRMRPRLHAATGEAAKRENVYHVDWMEAACMAKLPRDLREAAK